jgi:endonuclease/exonuclease/phosphatase family metal-dependent hydrolase
MRTIGFAVCTVTLSLLVSAFAAPATGEPAPDPQQRTHQARKAAVDLRVASYNVRSVSLDQADGEIRPWRERRGMVIANILGENVDVIGVQEVNPSKAFASRLVDGHNQFLDLRNGLNKAGGTFALTNSYAFNCKKASTQYKCKKKNRKASHSDRILYNTQTVSLVKQGKLKYKAQKGKLSPDHMGWAVLRSKLNGEKFLFTTTHLEPKNETIRRKQWREMIRKINDVEGGLPVIATGDFNIHKYSPMAKTFLPRMKKAGYGDVRGQQYRINPIRNPRAATTINGWMNTANKFQRDVRGFGYWNEQHKAGQNIDWIWADNQMPVREWKVVTNWDPNTWQVNGVIASDHNMVRATLGLG